MNRLVTGNEAVALGAIGSAVKVVTGYPGTPSTGVISSLLKMHLPDTYVEWSTNEKVALEIAAGTAWAGHKAMCTMKMSGINVAYDSLISIAYSGCDGALVIYVADDPGINAGMCEQDTRLFALMSDLPILEPASVRETHEMTRRAFDLSEQIKGPVFLRLVTAVADSYGQIEVEQPAPVSQEEPRVTKDIARYTKAGTSIVNDQRRDLMNRLEKSAAILSEMNINRLKLAPQNGGVGILAAGVAAAYLQEGIDTAQNNGIDCKNLSILEVKASNPFPKKEVTSLLNHCSSILVLEELEPVLEQQVYTEAFKISFQGSIIGKMDGPLSRMGEYGVKQVVQGLAAAMKTEFPDYLFPDGKENVAMAAARPATVCAGCPHRGTYMALNQAIRRARFKKDEVIVTGDIGCTILGMNPPFETVWTEISMGASIGLAQGYVHAGVKTPVIATMGDSTFFHGGIPGLVNAIQHQINLTMIIMDNRWTCMTGMQTNPGTPQEYQQENSKGIDIARVLSAMDIEQFYVVDPFELNETAQIIQDAIVRPGVKVILSRQECAIQAQRRGLKAGKITIVAENCNLCKLCVMVTGCPALKLGGPVIDIDPHLCYGCGMCVQSCNRGALIKEPVE